MRYLDYKIAYRQDDVNIIKEGGLFPHPKSLTIYPSEVCNLNCIGCNSKPIHRKNGFMDFETFEKIIKDFRIYGGEAVAFEGGGEPMLHPKIGFMITSCVGQELKVGIITNGTIYRKEMLYADWIRISIHNPLKILSIVKKNIKRLMKNRTITTIGVKFLRSKFGFNIVAGDMRVDYVQIKNLRNSPYSLVKNPKYVKPCGLTPLRAVVDYDGTFYPCPYFYAQKNTAMGKGVLSELWGTKAHKRAIKNIKNCNKYDCPLLEIDWNELRKADLDFKIGRAHV